MVTQKKMLKLGTVAIDASVLAISPCYSLYMLKTADMHQPEVFFMVTGWLALRTGQKFCKLMLLVQVLSQWQKGCCCINTQLHTVEIILECVLYHLLELPREMKPQMPTVVTGLIINFTGFVFSLSLSPFSLSLSCPPPLFYFHTVVSWDHFSN